MAVFCSSLPSCFPGMLLTYFLNDFEIVPVAPIITGIYYYYYYYLKEKYLLVPAIEPRFVGRQSRSQFIAMSFVLPHSK